MAVYTTEIASDQISSDNPIHQRLLIPYYWVKEIISRDVVELGCGEGRGVEIIASKTNNYLGIDKIDSVIEKLHQTYPKHNFQRAIFPPASEISDGSYDFVISFQVIEHIRKDKLFLEDIKRILKPGGIAILTTPNSKMSLSRNPWHIREYTAQQLTDLASEMFNDVQMKGIGGNEKVLKYHERNRQSVQRIMKWDIFNMQYWLPAFILKIPYEILNRRNRNHLQSQNDDLVIGITHEDFFITDDADQALDLLLIVKK